MPCGCRRPLLHLEQASRSYILLAAFFALGEEKLPQYRPTPCFGSGEVPHAQV